MSSEAEARAKLIGRRVLEARLSLGLTLQEVGERWAIVEAREKPYPPMKVWLIEAGRRKRIGEDELAALAVVFRKSLAYFTTPYIDDDP